MPNNLYSPLKNCHIDNTLVHICTTCLSILKMSINDSNESTKLKYKLFCLNAWDSVTRFN